MKQTTNISDREELLCMQAKFLHLRLDMNPFKDEMDMISPPLRVRLNGWVSLVSIGDLLLNACKGVAVSIDCHFLLILDS